MTKVNRCLYFAALSLLLAGICFAQADSSKKSYTFHGKVESVDQSSKSMKVNGEEVKGWMKAMTMDYKVDDGAVLKKVKPGDRIMATVYDGDMVLHNVQVMPNQGGESKPKK
jgi:Cu/Ag efflux protein CusF